MEKELRMSIDDPTVEIHYPVAEAIAKIIVDTPEDSVGIIIVKERKNMDIIAEALTMYALLKAIRQPLRAAYKGPEDKSICSWCWGEGQGINEVDHTEDCWWTASRQIVNRIEKVD